MQVQGALRFTEYDAADPEAIEAGRLVINAIRARETPWLPPMTAHRRVMDVKHGWDGTPERHFLGRLDGDVVGEAALEFGEWDNTELAWANVFVHPDHRRQGHGSDLLAHLMQLARERGSRSFGMDGWELPGVEEFAGRHGFRRGNRVVHRVQHLGQLPAGLVEEVRDEALPHAKDYELIRLDAPSPAELMPALAELTAAINDAPIGELDLEPENFPAERILGYERTQLTRGNRLHRLVAREKSTGRLAGHTIMAVSAEEPQYGDQHDTSVLREHRGHRLGLLLKAEMLLWLREVEPQVERIDTWNDEGNDHMIEVNERLCYRVTSRQLEFQRVL